MVFIDNFVINRERILNSGASHLIRRRIYSKEGISLGQRVLYNDFAGPALQFERIFASVRNSYRRLSSSDDIIYGNYCQFE